MHTQKASNRGLRFELAFSLYRRGHSGRTRHYIYFSFSILMEKDHISSSRFIPSTSLLQTRGSLFLP